jgi:hypothetical protein
MAKIVLVCPFCQKKLETPDGNIGRDGQCPACEKIFEITAPERSRAAGPAGGEAGGWLAGAGEFEYRDTTALAATVAVAIAVGLLIASTFLPWGAPYGRLAPYLAGVKAAVLAASVACCAFFLFSLAGGKSLMPAAMVSGAWGTVVVVWTWGIWFFAHRTVGDLIDSARPEFVIKGGLFASLGAGLLAAVAAVYVCMHGKTDSTFNRLGFFTLAAQLCALIVGLLAVSVQVRAFVAEASKNVRQPVEAVVPDREPPPVRAAPDRSLPPKPNATPQSRRRDEPPPSDDEPPKDQGPQAEPDEDAVPFIPADEDEG